MKNDPNKALEPRHMLWTGINWFAKVQTEQNLGDAQQQLDKMLKR